MCPFIKISVHEPIGACMYPWVFLEDALERIWVQWMPWGTEAGWDL